MRIRDENGWGLVSHDEKLGRTVWTMEENGKTHYRTDYRVDNIVDQNKEHAAELRGRAWGGGQRIASIPLNVYYDQVAPAVQQDDQRFLSKWLNDGDNAAFRVKEGRV